MPEPTPTPAPTATPPAATPAPSADGQAQPATSAAAAFAAPASADGQPPAPTPAPTPSGDGQAQLGQMSDDAYALLVQPDAPDQQEPPDRSLVTAMAKDLREAGIQPDVMAKVAPIYRKVIDAEIKRAAEERAERMKAMTEKAMSLASDDQKRDIAAAYKKFIEPNPALKQLIDTTEIGSDPDYLKILSLAGAALRAENPAPAAAAAGSSTYDTDAALFNATVRKEYR